MDASREAQLRDLQERFARYESKLVPLEKGYAQLRQRHADLLKAYSELRKAHVRESTSGVSVAEAHPVAAP
jgi:predicted  nucleic acid-binding Zn-ribbon protein